VSAERALKALETLGRARDMELTERRREAARLQNQHERVIKAVADLRQAMADEGEATAGDPAMMNAYALFAASARRRIVALQEAKTKLEAEIDRADAAIAEAYRAFKQIEQAAETRREEIAEEAARKERAVADDLAAVRALRNSA